MEEPAPDFAEVGPETTLQRPLMLGVRYRPDASPARVGSSCILRAFSVIYADVVMGDHVQTGHHVMIREHTRIGTRVVIGTSTIIDGQTTIGSFVKIEGGVYIPTHTTVGDHVFIGPGAILTNDRYPLRQRDSYEPEGPTLEDSVTLGAGVVVLPGVRIGKGAFVAAGAVVTKHVPEWALARGVPAKVEDLPANLQEENRAKRW